MGIYLPTISFLIEKEEIPLKPIETLEEASLLLEKYYQENYFFQCTTRGYNHLELFRRMVEEFQLPEVDFYQEEYNALPPEKCRVLLNSLQKIEQLFLEESSKITENLISQEKKMWQVFINNNSLNKKTQERYVKEAEKKFDWFKALSVLDLYQKIPITKDIDDFGLHDIYKEEHHEYIAVFYWLKAQLYLLEKAVKQQKAMMHIWISP